MSDWQRDTRADYQRKGFASRSGYGRSPAFVIVDFINGFTDPTTPLGGDFAWQINATLINDVFKNGTPEQIDRVTQAFLPMKKLDLPGLQRAYDGQ